jgi:hypothetical protein
MDTLQETIIKRRTSSNTAIRNAQLLDCAQFCAKYEKYIEWDEVSNLSDFNDGIVNLIYHGTDKTVSILFSNGDYIDWGFPRWGYCYC